MHVPVFIVLGAYLLGSLSFSRLVTRRMAPDIDVSRIVVKDPETGKEYPMHAGATTASMALGWQAGCLISLLDMGKALLPVLLARQLYPDQHFHLLAAVAVVAGNNWPIWHRFKGGMGMSAIYGGLLVIDPLSIVVTAGTGFFLGMIVLRNVKLIGILPFPLLIPWFWFRTGAPNYLLYAIALNVLFFASFLPTVRHYIGPDKVSDRLIMEQMPMGRGMLRILEMLGLKKSK